MKYQVSSHTTNDRRDTQIDEILNEGFEKWRVYYRSYPYVQGCEFAEIKSPDDILNDLILSGLAQCFVVLKKKMERGEAFATAGCWFADAGVEFRLRERRPEQTSYIQWPEIITQ